VELVPLIDRLVPAVTALEAEVFAGRDPWPEKAFRQEAGNSHALWVVAVEGERVLGYGGAWLLAGGICHVLNLGVAASARRSGTGEAIMRALLSLSAGKGYTGSWLEVRKGNEPALALYRKLGYREAGVRPRHYSDGCDAIVMVLRGARDGEPGEG
jgi:ribosomal-protein-alanine N-acetyltransferase